MFGSYTVNYLVKSKEDFPKVMLISVGGRWKSRGQKIRGLGVKKQSISHGWTAKAVDNRGEEDDKAT